MTDASGFIQFLEALAEIALGAHEPSITPVWCRELLNARDPPRITCTHLEYEEVLHDTKILTKDLSQRSFFFGPNQIAAIRKLFPHQHTRFEALTAFLWRCRTIALQLHPDEEIRLTCACSAGGGKFRSSSIVPRGYYGNVVMHTAVATTVKKLCESSFGYALELVKKVKAEATTEFLQSTADLMVIRAPPTFSVTRSWFVSDLTRVGFREVDFGWGKAEYGGPAMAGFGPLPEISYFVACKNEQGEEGISVAIFLPAKAMKMLVQELDNLLN